MIPARLRRPPRPRGVWIWSQQSSGFAAADAPTFHRTLREARREAAALYREAARYGVEPPGFWLYYGAAEPRHGDYPDAILERGPRGGIRCTPA